MQSLEQNKQLVRRFMTELGRANKDALAELMAPDFKGTTMGTASVCATRNFQDIIALMDLLKVHFPAGLQFEFLTMTAEADRVSCEIQGRSQTAAGVRYDNQYHLLFYVEGNHIRLMREYFCTKLAESVFGPLLRGANV